MQCAAPIATSTGARSAIVRRSRLALGVVRADRGRGALDSAPLVLHGASGVDDATLRRCAALGVVKFNVNTELRRAFFDAVEQALGQTVAGYDLASLMGAGRTAVRDTAAAIATMLAQTGNDDHGELKRLENR